MTAVMNKKIKFYGPGVESGAIDIKESGNTLDDMKHYNNHIINLINNGVC